MSFFKKGFSFNTTAMKDDSGESSDAVELPDTTTDGPIIERRKDSVILASGAEVTESQANHRLSLFKKTNRFDPNMEKEDLERIDEAMEDHNVVGEVQIIDEYLENSPYPEVRAAVRNYDEDVPASTIRAWVIGLLLTTIGSGLNALFNLRSPAITITSVVAQLVAYPMGVGWTLIFPDKQFTTFGVKWNLSPGPFNIKEHTLIVVMANATFGGGAGYFIDTLVAQKGFYGQDFGWGFGFLLAVTTQCAGYGIAGICRKLLVEPSSMIWPRNLVNTAFMYALHDHSKTDPSKTNGWSISRYRLFLYVFAGSFAWYWFPGYIAQFLSVFAFATWAAPNNVIVNQLFGGYTGLSLIPITFDWTQVTGYIFSPLIAPWHAIANTLIGMVIWFWICTAGIHYSNTWYAKYLPMSDSNSYDNHAKVYNVTRILTPEYTLDLKKYEAYSPLFLSTTFALTYGLSFAAISSVVVHTALFHGEEIWIRLRAPHGSLDDVHTKMMRKYKPAPTWWYLAILVVCIALTMVMIYIFPTHMTWWSVIVAFLIALFWCIPIGIIQAVTNIQLGLNVFTEFIIGYMLPGRPIAMMLFKTYGYITMRQALAFAQDLKLGWYMKVPPRTMFWGQVVATIWSSLVQLAVVEWALNNIAGICSSTQPNHFTCPGGRVFFNASVIWGLIGPQRIFSNGALYQNLQYFWLAGAALPALIYLGARMFPKSNIRFLNAPVIFGGTGEIPPATPLNYLSWGIVGFVFNKLIRNRYRGWWMRFNYITSAGLDAGLAISTIVIIAALNLTNTKAPKWWGNEVVTSTLDAKDKAVNWPVPKDPGYFGPARW